MFIIQDWQYGIIWNKYKYKQTFVDIRWQAANKYFPGKPFAAFRSLTVGRRPRWRRQSLHGCIDQMRTRVVQQSRLIFECLKKRRFTWKQKWTKKLLKLHFVHTHTYININNKYIYIWCIGWFTEHDYFLFMFFSFDNELIKIIDIFPVVIQTFVFQKRIPLLN